MFTGTESSILSKETWIGLTWRGSWYLNTKPSLCILINGATMVKLQKESVSLRPLNIKCKKWAPENAERPLFFRTLSLALMCQDLYYFLIVKAYTDIIAFCSKESCKKTVGLPRSKGVCGAMDRCRWKLKEHKGNIESSQKNLFRIEFFHCFYVVERNYWLRDSPFMKKGTPCYTVTTIKHWLRWKKYNISLLPNQCQDIH